MIHQERIAEYLNISVEDVRNNNLRPGYDWVHKKTGNIYTLANFVLDTTNETEGRLMVVYHRNGLIDTNIYVREIKEFLEKFYSPKERIK